MGHTDVASAAVVAMSGFSLPARDEVSKLSGIESSTSGGLVDLLMMETFLGRPTGREWDAFAVCFAVEAELFLLLGFTTETVTGHTCGFWS